MPTDPVVSDKERVKMTALEVWKVSGFRFTYVFIDLTMIQDIQSPTESMTISRCPPGTRPDTGAPKMNDGRRHQSPGKANEFYTETMLACSGLTVRAVLH